ncbi:cadherin domain-containing protein [Geotalea toluenoxydans]|uniref:cadherin domain-containing protein n=1 Tax=Geotalea toluenoxydans TaxID=421624 RepID=UPI0006D197D8|nr:cadherin domain-containing protein [Geotalea toluenoxydans]
MTINLTDRNDNAPVITSGSSGTVAENATTDTVIYQAAARDADTETTITYSLKPGEDASLLTIDPGSGAVTLNNSADFETKTSYTFTVIADDGANSTEQGITVNVVNLNDNAPVITSGAMGSVTENAPTGTVIYQATAADADEGSVLTYSLKAGGDADQLNIDAGSGAVTLRNPADFETRPGYSFTVIVNDGLYSAEQGVTVGVVDVNEAPVITSNGGGATAAMSVAENQTAVTTVTSTDEDAGDSKTFSITGGADRALFTIDSVTGVLTFLVAPDHEARADADNNNIYDVQVSVTDTGGLTDSQDLTVTVTDIREHFVVEASGAWVDLNANGMRDGSDTTRADFTPGTGNFDLSAIHGVIHYNNVPTAAINLAGFSADDRIEMDARAFIDNGHEALQILTRPNIKTLDAITAYGASHMGSTSNALVALNNGAGTRYHNNHTYVNISAKARSVDAGLSLHGLAGSPRSLDFSSKDGLMTMRGHLASQLSPDLLLQQAVDFVNIPAPTTIQVIVERNGAIIDTDGDGVWDVGEDRPAVFGAGGNADLTGGKPVTIHFNDIPQDTLNLTGFGADDKLELDIQELQGNDILRSATRLKSLSALTSITGLMTPFRITYAFNSQSLQPVRLTVRESPLSTPFNGQPADAHAIMRIAEMGNTINGKRSGAFAYWTDSANALNDARQILPGYTGNNTAAVLATLNSDAPHGGWWISSGR